MKRRAAGPTGSPGRGNVMGTERAKEKEKAREGERRDTHFVEMEKASEVALETAQQPSQPCF